MLRRILLCGGLLAAFALPSSALAWGKLGHRLVAQVAERDLTPAARAEVSRLLAGEPDPTLPGIATWADELREHDPDLGRRSASWHYVNVGESNCRYEARRDCPGGNCVVEALNTQTAILADRTRPRAERAQALKFVVHFTGDAHQPLHAGYAHNKGGNTIQIDRRGEPTNLHAFWDSGMIKEAVDEGDNWFENLPTVAVRREAPMLELAPERWIEHSCGIMRAAALAFPAIDARYITYNMPVVKQQISDAGHRLANLLNTVLAEDTATESQP